MLLPSAGYLSPLISCQNHAKLDVRDPVGSAYATANHAQGCLLGGSALDEIVGRRQGGLPTTSSWPLLRSADARGVGAGLTRIVSSVMASYEATSRWQA